MCSISVWGFKLIAFFSLEDVAQTKTQVKIIIGQFLKKISMTEFWFLFTVLLHNLFYQCMKVKLTAFLAHLSTEYSVSYCDHSPSVGVRRSVRRPSVHNFLVNTLASTNINQSAPNLVKVYMNIRSRMISIMELIGPELSELSALEFENLPYLTLFIL